MDFDDIIRLGVYFVLPVLFKFLFDKGKKDHEKREQSKKIDTNKDIKPYLDQDYKVFEVDKKESYSFDKPEIDYSMYEIDYMSQRISEYERTSTTEKPKSPTRIKNKTIVNNQITDQIKDSEISFMDIDLGFKKEDIVKGIIMSEILSKPKAYQKR